MRRREAKPGTIMEIGLYTINSLFTTILKWEGLVSIQSKYNLFQFEMIDNLINNKINNSNYFQNKSEIDILKEIETDYINIIESINVNSIVWESIPIPSSVKNYSFQFNYPNSDDKIYIVQPYVGEAGYANSGGKFTQAQTFIPL